VPFAIRTSWLFGAIAFTFLVLGVLKVARRGQVEVLAPRSSDLLVTVDADQPLLVPAGTHQTMAVPKGTHVVTLRTTEGTSALPFEIEGGLDWYLASGGEAAWPRQPLLPVSSRAPDGQIRKAGHHAGERGPL